MLGGVWVSRTAMAVVLVAAVAVVLLLGGSAPVGAEGNDAPGAPGGLSPAERRRLPHVRDPVRRGATAPPAVSAGVPFSG